MTNSITDLSNYNYSHPILAHVHAMLLVSIFSSITDKYSQRIANQYSENLGNMRQCKGPYTVSICLFCDQTKYISVTWVGRRRRYRRIKNI